MRDDKKTIGTSKRWHPTNPPLTFTRNLNMENKVEKGNWQNKEMAISPRSNVKIDKESLALLKQIVNISNEDIKDYNWVMFTHAMDFFNECTS